MKETLLSLTGGTCTSCSIGIEHMARRIKGVDEVYVDRGQNQITLRFDGNPATIEKVIGFVRAIGYDADVVQESRIATPTP